MKPGSIVYYIPTGLFGKVMWIKEGRCKVMFAEYLSAFIESNVNNFEVLS